MIRVVPSDKGELPLYYVKKEDAEELKSILKQYNIKTRLDHSSTTGQLIFWKEELDEIEKQYKLARKQERQR